MPMSFKQTLKNDIFKKMVLSSNLSSSVTSGMITIINREDFQVKTGFREYLQ